MLVGVTMATVTDVDVGFAGFLIGMVAVLGAGQSTSRCLVSFTLQL